MGILVNLLRIYLSLAVKLQSFLRQLEDVVLEGTLMVTQNFIRIYAGSFQLRYLSTLHIFLTSCRVHHNRSFLHCEEFSRICLLYRFCLSTNIRIITQYMPNCVGYNATLAVFKTPSRLQVR